MDMQLITYCIWNTPKQREEVKSIVKEIVQTHGLEWTTAIDDTEEQIKIFKTDVDSTWYKSVEEVTHEEAIEKMIANRIFYEVEKNKDGITFISKKLVDDYYSAVSYRRRYCYTTDDTNLTNQYVIDHYAEPDKNFIMINSSSSPRTIKIKTKTVVDQKAGLVKDTVIFNNLAVYTATKEKFNTEKYTPIANSIEKQLDFLQNFRTKIEKHYSENLFAQQSFKEIITSKIEDEKKKFEDLKLELTKQKKRYEK